MKALVIWGLALGPFVLSRPWSGRFGQWRVYPDWEEGDIATHIIIPPGSSLSQEIETTTKAEKILMDKFPEVIEVVSKIGSAEVPTDPMPMEVADAMVILKDKSEWTSARTKEALMSKMEHALEDLPGVTTEFTQPIQMRFNELMTGVRSDVAVKIFGEDIDLLAGLAEQAMPLIQNCKGVEDACPEAVAYLPQSRSSTTRTNLHYMAERRRPQSSRPHGFCGRKSGWSMKAKNAFDLVVRLQNDSRQDISNLKICSSLPFGQSNSARTGG
ncbi:MAG: efflux RND transporter permease subunit [Saprospiraceae bacterium]|nr:efflux RND transporter permease subunit [Saprospiraceae bacterium]